MSEPSARALVEALKAEFIEEMGAQLEFTIVSSAGRHAARQDRNSGALPANLDLSAHPRRDRSLRGRAANAEQEREALRRRWPDAWRDGGRTALGLLDGEREAGGYPKGYHKWPLDRRNAWCAAYNLAYSERRKPK